MRHLLMTSILTLCLIGIGFSITAQSASACPMCKAAAEKSEQASSRQPQAYFYSIMFMLAVPAALFSSIGYTLFQLNRSEANVVEETDMIPEDLPDLSDL